MMLLRIAYGNNIGGRIDARTILRYFSMTYFTSRHLKELYKLIYILHTRIISSIHVYLVSSNTSV